MSVHEHALHAMRTYLMGDDPDRDLDRLTDGQCRSFTEYAAAHLRALGEASCR
jgi:hypothetical protein